jgi:aminopeptidase N
MRYSVPIKCIILVGFTLLLVHNKLLAKDNPPQERNIQLFHYSANISLNPVTKVLQGTAVYDIRGLRPKVDSFVFYTPGMTITSVSLKSYNGKEPAVIAKFLQDKDNLIIFPGSFALYNLAVEPQCVLEIQYFSLTPRELHFTGWDDPSGRMRKQVWAHRPFGWIPFVDQMTSQDISITFDKNYLVVANGERISKAPSGDTAFTWHYRLDKPHPFYSVCLVAGDYRYRQSKTIAGTPLELWYYPDMEDRFDITYRYQKEMFSFFEEETGFRYPYSLYRNLPVADYLYGAMECTTSTVYADFMQVDARGALGRNFINTNAHELAHQWFGNCINDKTSSDLWLTESFATYFAKIFERKYLGEEAYEFQRDFEKQKALKIAESNNNALGSGQAGTERWYQKGSLVMDMLRDVVGEEEFKAALHYYLVNQAYGEAESNDFLKAIYNASGQTLDWFFEEWIYRGGEPEYKVSWKEVKRQDGKLLVQVSVEQVQTLNKPGEYFKMPVNIEVYDKGFHCISKKVGIERQSTLIEIPIERETSFIVFDAGNRILKKLQLSRSMEELGAQAEHSRHMADRLEAIRALQSFLPAQKRDVLTRCFDKDKFNVCRAEIVSQLASDSLSYRLLTKAIHDRDVNVRKSVTEKLTRVPAVLVPEYKKLLKDSAYFVVEAALTNLCNSAKGDRQQVESYLNTTSRETGWRGRNIRVCWLGLAIDQYPEKKEFLNELIDYAGSAFDFETRINALNEIKKLNYLDEKVAGYLHTAAAYWNYKLSGPAKDLINYYKAQRKYQILLEKSGN